jgi:hypothetical protein
MIANRTVRLVMCKCNFASAKTLLTRKIRNWQQFQTANSCGVLFPRDSYVIFVETSLEPVVRPQSNINGCCRNGIGQCLRGHLRDDSKRSALANS